MLVIDAFIFYNEIDILRYRLEVLNDHVDYFVLVESTHTFTGVPKRLHFNECKHTFEKFLHKIIHVVMDDFPHQSIVTDGRQWENETFQREHGIPRGLNQIQSLNPNDYVIHSDLDEIINPSVIQNVRDRTITGDIYSLEMDMYYYNLTTYIQKWSVPCILKVWLAMQSSYRSCGASVIPNAGWHLSYFGDANFIKNKLLHFGHQEFNKDEFTNEDNINSAIQNGTDLFKRENVMFKKIELCDNTNLPPRLDLLSRFI